MINACRPIIILEIGRIKFEAYEHDRGDISAYLQSCDYRLTTIASTPLDREKLERYLGFSQEFIAWPNAPVETGDA